MPQRPLVYDIEILKAVPQRGAERIPGIEYCEGWHDKQNMGIAVICAYDYEEKRYRVFTKESFDEFAALACKRSPLVGHNAIAFDHAVCEACGVFNDESGPSLLHYYDTLVELWVAAGLGRAWGGPQYGGFSLDDCAAANFGLAKTGHGALAPVDWQRGLYGKVIDYCLNDVALTKRLFERMAVDGFSIDPRDKRSVLRTRLWNGR
jgi:hypothetical protein